MGKKSKSGSNAPVLLASERRRTGNEMGTISTRIGTASQLPFGYCALSNIPTTPGDAVATPSGRIYRREAILEHLLTHAQEIREAEHDRDFQEMLDSQKGAREAADQSRREAAEFQEQQLHASISTGASTSTSTSASTSAGGVEVDYRDSKRKRLIDDSTDAERLKALQEVSVWMPQSSSSHSHSKKAKRERPTSPHSKQPLKARDLVSLHLIRDESSGGLNSSTVHYQCAVSGKAITAQPAVVIRPSGVVMLESVALQTVLRDETTLCPVTGRAFDKHKDILKLHAAATGFAASGNVESKRYKPNMI